MGRAPDKIRQLRDSCDTYPTAQNKRALALLTPRKGVHCMVNSQNSRPLDYLSTSGRHEHSRLVVPFTCKRFNSDALPDGKRKLDGSKIDRFTETDSPLNFDTACDGRIYVGNLPLDIRTRDIEELFSRYGKLTSINLKNKRGPPFAFVEFKEPRDAEESVRQRDGYIYDGYTLRAEFPRGSRVIGGGRGGGRERGGPGIRMAGQPSGRTPYRGLPPNGSWQDLKDHMREAGGVCYVDVFKDGTGVVEFLRKEDMRYAIRTLDGTKFRSHED